MSDDRPTFGAVLRELRLARRLTQEALAERARLSVEAVSALERGHRRAPYAHTLGLLMQALELDATARERFEAAAARSAAARNDARLAPADGDASQLQTLPHNFPERLTRFVGRDTELAALAAAIARYRLTTITGAGGIGKTRIAIELGAGVREQYPDGARFIELGALRDPALLAQEIGAALQLREQAGQAVLDTVVTTLRDRRVLLVIDNCEHVVIEAAHVLETILRRCPNVTVIATSREALRIDGEFVFRLATFSVPAKRVRCSAETALRYSSVAFFVDRALRVDATFTIDDHNAGDVIAICQRVDGIPLALEIVAAQVAVMGPAQIAGRLPERFLLAEGTRTAVPRQRTLRSLVAWSVDLLSAAEQLVFRRLAVFSGTWTIEAAETVCTADPIDRDSLLDHVASLVQKSLIAAENDRDGRRRLRLLQMTREYAHKSLLGSGELDATMARHTAYILAFARRVGSSVAATPDLAWLETVDREIENVRTALEWSLHRRNDVVAGAELAALLGHYWDYRSSGEGTRWLSLARAGSEHFQPHLAARVLLESVRIAPYLDGADAYLARALEVFRSLGDTAGVSQTLEMFGKTLINLGRHGEARTALSEALARAHSFEDGDSIVRLTTSLAFADLYNGDTEAAAAGFRNASGPTFESQRNRDSAYVLRGLAEVALVENDCTTAIELAQRFLAILERLGDTREAGTAHYLVAQALLAADRLTEAAAEVAAAFEALRGSDFPLCYLEATIVAAAIFERRRDDVRAVRLIGYVQRRASTFPYRPTPLIGGLFDRTVDALTQRMRPDEYRSNVAQGNALDDERVAFEFPPQSIA